MRTGDSHSSTGMTGFLDEMFEIIDRSRIGLIRMDSGFYSKLIMSKLELHDKPITYIIKAKMTSRLRSAIYEMTKWHNSKLKSSSYEYGEINYKAVGWQNPRRIVVTRKRKTDDASEGRNELFPDLSEKEAYE